MEGRLKQKKKKNKNWRVIDVSVVVRVCPRVKNAPAGD
jgi:hypothetical protein